MANGNGTELSPAHYITGIVETALLRPFTQTHIQYGRIARRQLSVKEFRFMLSYAAFVAKRKNFSVQFYSVLFRFCSDKSLNQKVLRFNLLHLT